MWMHLPTARLAFYLPSHHVRAPTPLPWCSLLQTGSSSQTRFHFLSQRIKLQPTQTSDLSQRLDLCFCPICQNLARGPCLITEHPLPSVSSLGAPHRRLPGRAARNPGRRLSHWALGGEKRGRRRVHTVGAKSHLHPKKAGRLRVRPRLGQSGHLHQNKPPAGGSSQQLPTSAYTKPHRQARVHISIPIGKWQFYPQHSLEIAFLKYN